MLSLFIGVITLAMNVSIEELTNLQEEAKERRREAKKEAAARKARYVLRTHQARPRLPHGQPPAPWGGELGGGPSNPNPNPNPNPNLGRSLGSALTLALTLTLTLTRILPIPQPKSPTPTPGQVRLLPGALLQTIVELAAQASVRVGLG